MKTKSISIYGVYLDAKGKVLLIKDSNSGLWGFPGGRVEPGETHEDTLKREFQEEAGLKIRGNLTYITLQKDDIKHRYFYGLQCVEGVLKKAGNGTDVESAAYFDVSNLPLDIALGVKSIVKHFHA